MHATTARADQPHKDNIFGICNALGEDLGFDPFYLRLAFAVSLLASPEITLLTYAGLGIVVLASRLLTRQWRTASPGATPDADQPRSPAIRDGRTPDRAGIAKMLEAA